MPTYLQQVSYTPEAWKALVQNPQNRLAIERLGGRIVTGWFAFGDYDAVLITEFPTNVEAAAIAVAFAAGGACKNVKTTPLLSAEEAVLAIKKAAGTGYRSATAAS
jgi:uncharacterized protein with GYD domain